MTTAFLKLTPLTVGQAGKEGAVNDSDARIEHATQRTVDIDFTSGDVSLTEDQWTTNYIFRCTTVGVDRTLTVRNEVGSNGANTAERVFAVENTATGNFTVTVTQDAGGTDVIVLPGEQVSMYADGTDVKRLDNSFDLGTFVAGAPTASQLMLRFTTNRTFILPVGLVGSAGSWSANATGAHGYIIRKNGGASLGTVDVALGAQVATFTFTVATEFAIGDVLTVEAPAVPDATSVDLALTLAGFKG
jgi:hypothetical protein